LARAGALARRLRRALAPSQGCARRREPQPLPAVLPVPGAAQAGAERRRGRLLPVARRDGAGAPETRPAPGRGRLGEPHARRGGAGLAGVVRRHRDLAVHVLPAVRRARAAGGLGGAPVWLWPPPHDAAGAPPPAGPALGAPPPLAPP